jgi:hypothetical protein
MQVPYLITHVEHRCWPAPDAVEEALGRFDVSINRLKEVLRSCSHGAPARDGVGFQLDLGPTIERHFASSLADNGLHSANTRYSPNLNENADLAFGRDYAGTRVYVEIEFRPNVEKDLVKFQIGANAGSLAAAVLILTTDRTSVNAAYTTMPEFAKFERVIDELRPAYPLLLLGFRGEQR